MRKINDKLKEAMLSSTPQCEALIGVRYPAQSASGTTITVSTYLNSSVIQTVEVTRSINGGTYAVGTADAATAKITLLKSAIFNDTIDFYSMEDHIDIYMGYYTGEDDDYKGELVVKDGIHYLIMGHFKIDKSTLEINGLFATFEAYDSIYWLGFKAPVKSIDSMKRTVGIATRLSYMDYFIGSGNGFSVRNSSGEKWGIYDVKCSPSLTSPLIDLLQESDESIEKNLKVSTRWNNLKIAHRSEYLFDFNHCEGSARDLIARLAGFCGTSAYMNYYGRLDFRQIDNTEIGTGTISPDMTITPQSYSSGDVSFDSREMTATSELISRSIMNIAVDVSTTSSSRTSNTDTQRWFNTYYGSEAAKHSLETGMTLTMPSNMFRYVTTAGEAGDSFDLDDVSGKESEADSAFNGAGVDWQIRHSLAYKCGLSMNVHIEGFSATVCGFLQAELLDSIEIVDVDGKSHYVRPLSITNTYNGTIKTTLSANSFDEDEVASSSSSSSTVSVIPASSMTDCVVAEGVCDFWSWRMWASGIAECWGETSSTTVSFSNEWGSLYESDAHSNGFPGNTSLSSLLTFSVEIEGITYNKLFISLERCDANFHSASGSCFVECPIGGSTLVTPTVLLLRGSTGSVTGTYTYYAIGRWK